MQARHNLSRLGIGVLCLAFMAGAGVADDWPSWSGPDTTRARFSEEQIVVDDANPFMVDWSMNTNSLIVSSPAVSNGLVFVGTTGGRILALREDTGAVAWEYNAPNAVRSSPFVVRDRVFFACQDGRLYAFRASTGALLWQLMLGGSPMSSPVVVGNLLFVGTGFPSPRVLAIDISGTAPAIAWQIAVTGIVYSSAAVVDGRVLIGSNGGKYYAFSPADGSSMWAQPFLASGIVNFSSPLAHAGRLFASPGGVNNWLYRIDAANGALAGPTLNLRPDGYSSMIVSSPARIGDTIFVVAGNLGAPSTALQVWAVNASTMQPVWGPVTHGDTVTGATLASTPAGTDPAAASGVPAAIFFATQSSRQLVARRTGDGALLAAVDMDSAVFSSPAIANARVFVAASSGTIYAFRGQNRPPAPPITLSPANDVTIASSTPLITWSGATDPDGDALSVVLRYDFDGEVLDSWAAEVEIPDGQSAYMINPAVADNSHVSYAIRVRDSGRAFSCWTATESFWVDQTMGPPAAPSLLQVVAGNGTVDLSWPASPSVDVAGYEVAWTLQGGPLSPYVQLGNVLSWQVAGLQNGAEYLFSLRACDLTGLSSEPVTALAQPVSPATPDEEPVVGPVEEETVVVQGDETSPVPDPEPLYTEDGPGLDNIEVAEPVPTDTEPAVVVEVCTEPAAPCETIVVAPVPPPFLTWSGIDPSTNSGASPATVTGGENVTFRVNYSHVDNLPPSTIQVWADMNGNGTFSACERFQMHAVDPVDTNCADGKEYGAALQMSFSGTIDPLVVGYRFHAKAAGEEAGGDPTVGVFNGTWACSIQVRNNRPALTWLEHGVFARDGAYPESAKGSPATFQFAVRYEDADNTPPAASCVQIDIDDNGTFDAEESFPMGAYSSSGIDSDSDGDYANGETYYAAVTLDFKGDGRFRYRFVFHDGARAAGTAGTASSASGPILFSAWYEDDAFAGGLASGSAAQLQNRRQTVRIHAPKRNR
ncbi:MAG: PQQ-binding-like beta-propeller repeat protein [Planctomycetota bacterium]|nr:PQQ-binding-like beta-propeller repeat protein [Planctomycetota bacterium]